MTTPQAGIARAGGGQPAHPRRRARGPGLRLTEAEGWRDDVGDPAIPPENYDFGTSPAAAGRG